LTINLNRYFCAELKNKIKMLFIKPTCEQLNEGRDFLSRGFGFDNK